MPGVRVDFDEALGSPKFVASTRGFLAAGSDSQQVVRTFVEEHSAMFGHGAGALAEARLARDYETPHNGMHTFVWQQELDGVRVFESTFQAHVTKAGELVNVASRFVPDTAAAAVKPTQVIDVKKAISAAGTDVGESVPPAQIAENAPPEGPSRKQRFRSTRLLEVSAEHVWLPIDEGSLRLAWEVTFTSKSRGEMFRSLVDIETGRVLIRQGLTEYISNASYRVFTSDSPTPMSPGLATPGTTQPAEAARTLVTLSAFDTTASPNGWIDDGVNETRGNNVDAHLDLNADDVADTPRPQGSPSRVFDFTFDSTQAPTSYQNAAITQLFYWNNYIHDRYYQLGFTEAAGNFQNNNFSKGGVGNDAVQADAQDGSGTNNANFSTPADGSAGRMQMYVFTGPTPDRDGDFDQEVVIHEYTHGLSNRLVGGGVGISSLQPRGMGEGWSDFYALCLLSQPADDPNGVYASGAYASYQLSGLTQNYYYGIRRYPYCTDLAKNPLTFKDIDTTQASAHTGVPKSPIGGSTANEVHNMGEVWCVALWDARANLVAKLGAAAGNDMILQLVTDGMKLAPANPNFLQARDAIVQADLVDNAGANSLELWNAFAKRGMGASATSPSSSTTTGLVEGFDVPNNLIVTLPASVTEGNVPTTGTVTASPAPSTNLTVTLTSNNPAQLTVPASVNIAAGQTSATFAISAVDDALLDGSPTVTVSPSGSGYNSQPGSTVVIDNETTTLTISLPASATEGDTGLTGTVTTAAVAGSPVVVALNSSDTSELTVPATVTIPAGQNSANFALTVVDDGVFDGPQTVTITATVAGWSSGSLSMVVNDTGRSTYAISGSDRGWYKEDGSHTPSNSNYNTGFSNSSNTELHSFFIFSIPTLAPGETILSAELHLDNPSNGFSSPDPSETLQFQDVITPISSLVDGTGGVAAFTDLGDGTVYGSRTVSTADNGTTVIVPLNGAFISAVIAAGGGQLAVGAQLTTLTRTSGVGEFVFGFSGAPQSTQLVLTTSRQSLTVSLPPIVTEGDGPATGTITVAPAPSSDLVVSLSSSNAARLAVPASVTIAAGTTSTTFAATVNDDALLNGTSNITVSPSAVGWTPLDATIAVNDNETATLTMTLPASATEGVGSVSAMVMVSAPVDADIAVQLTCSNANEIAPPASVTIPAGQNSATFSLVIVDDTRIDGSVTSNVTAHYPGWTDGVASIDVLDNENTALMLTLPASVREGDSNVGGGRGNAGGKGGKAFTSDKRLALAAPIRRNNSRANAIPTPTPSPTPTPTPSPTPTPTPSPTPTPTPSPVTIPGTVRIAGILSSDLVVALSSNDSTELTTPASVTILAGQTSATVPLTVVDDSETDGAQTVAVGAMASGFTAATADVIVQDNDVHHFAITPIASSQVRGVAFSVLISAKDVNDATITNYNSAIALTAAGDGGAVAISPTSASAFVNGVWTGSVTASDFGTNVVLTASDGASHMGASNAFEVGTGPLDHFTWSTIASPQTMDMPFNAAITAQDVGNNPVTSFAGAANLSAVVSVSNPAIGAGTGTWIMPFYGSYAKARTQVIYLASEMGGAARLSSVSLYVGTSSTGTFSNWTIRLKHTTQSSYTSGSWDGTGWTTVHQSNATPNAAGWVTFTFSTPFDYDGTRNLLVDFSFNNTSANSLTAYCRYTSATTRSVYGYASTGDPLTWSGTSGTTPITTTLIPNVQFSSESAVAVRPAATGAFSAGVWTGEVSVPFTSNVVRLAADDGAGHSGRSSTFATIAPVGGGSGGATVFTEDFESGTLRAAWTITGTNTYRTQVTTANTPHAGTRHLTMDSSGVSSYARNEATLTVNLAGRTGAQLTFWAKMFGDEPNGPPTAPFINGTDFDGVAMSADGTTWWEVQSLRSPTITGSWAQFTVNLDAAIAARGIAYNSAFKIRFNQYDDNSITTDGIAIDDIAVTATPISLVAVTVPTQATEGASALTGTVTLPSAQASNTTVTLTSNSPAKVTVPTSVAVPAGQLAANFTLSVLDDSVIDGSKTVTISAAASGLNTGSATINVLDNDIGTLALSVPASASEAAGSVQGTLTLSPAPAGNVVVTLSSSDTSAATVPTSVIFSIGQTSVAVPVTIINDTKINGTHPVTITASVSGWTSASGTINVLDNENTNLALTLPTVNEGGTASGTVSISGTLASALSVSLSSDNTTRLTVPASVTIPAGSTSTTFTLTGVDNALLDGQATVNVTASASGFTSATTATTVYDNDAHHFVLSVVSSPQTRDAAFTLTVTAKDVNDATLTSFGGPANLNGGAVPVSPATLSGFVSGVWTGQVTVTSTAAGVILTASDGSGHTGVSNAFDVIQPIDAYPENWPTFGNGPSHTGYQPVTLGTGSYQAGWTKTYSTATSGLFPVAISNGRIYVTPNGDTYLSALEATGGTELWRQTFDYASSINPPTVNAGKVYVQRGNNSSSRLWCLDAITGMMVWSAPFGAQWEGYFAPTVVTDSVWIDGGTFGGMYGFNTNSGTQRFFNSSLEQYDQWTPGYYLGTVYTWVAGVFRAHDRLTGTIRWSSTLSTGPGGSMNTVSAIDANKAFVVGNPNLYAIDLSTHATAWTVNGTFKGSPAVANGIVYALSGSDVKAYNVGTGALVGTYATGSSTIARQPIVTNDSLIVSSSTNTYIFTLGTFTPRQTLSSGGAASLANGVLYLAGSDGVLRTFRPSGMMNITVNVPASATEGSAPLTGTVTLSQAPGSDTAVSLISSDPSRVSVPASVAVLGGQTSATFTITIVDDALLNGSETVGVTAKGPSQLFLAGSAGITINDNESATLSVSVPASATEGAGSVTGTVTVSTAPSANVAVTVASSDTTEATVPVNVTILAGQTSATFTITIVDDTQIDGAQPATITASVAGWTSGSRTISVLDNESSNLSLSLSSVSEGSTGSGTVFISGTLASPLVVSLSSANTARLTVPATVTIPAGSTSASFTATGVDNAFTDGAVSVNVTASASSFTSATSAVTVYDNDVHHFSVSSIGSSQIANVTFSVYFYALSVDGYTISGFNSAANLSVTAGGLSLPVTPASVTFSSGYASISASVGATGSGATLQVSDGGGHTGTSNSFNVGTGPLHHFAVSAIASPQPVSTPFNATVTAKDVANNTVTSFTGTVALGCGPSPRAIGTGSLTMFVPMAASSHDCRTQLIYTAAEVGAGARKLTALSMNLSQVPSTLNNWTIRMKHTSLAAYSTASWDSTGWMTVYQTNLVVSATGWVTFQFTTPFDYDGVSNLMVDFSFNNSATGTDGYCPGTSGATNRMLYYYTNSAYGDPLTWSGTSSPTPNMTSNMPNIRLHSAGLPLTPIVTGAFASGVWTGAITVGSIASNITLQVSSGTAAGESNTFDVTGAPVLDVAPAGGLTAAASYSGPATPSSASWTLSNTGTGTLTWSIAKTAPWLVLSSTSGTLNSGASTTVTATISASGVAPGSYADTITFINATTGAGNTTRSAALTVTLPAPALAAEPPITGGAGNTISWSAVSGATAYEVQAADNAAFTSALSSGWITATSFNFPSLAAGATWHYRVRSRVMVPGATGSWSQTSQSEFATGTATNVSTSASPGRVLLNGAGGTFTVNENFDEAGTAWSSTQFPNISAGTFERTDLTGTGPNTTPPLSVNQGGDLEARLSGTRPSALMADVAANRFDNGSIEAYLAPGNQTSLHYAGLLLRATRTSGLLNGYGAIIIFYSDGTVKADFSRIISGGDNGTGNWFYSNTTTFTLGANENIHAQFSANGTTLSLRLWRVGVSGGVVTETPILFYQGTNTLTATDSTYTSGLAGLYDSFSNLSQTLFDDVTVTLPLVGYATAGSLISAAISPSPLVRWNSLSFTKDVSAAGTSLTVDVLDASGALLAANVANGADLNAIPAVAAVSSIRLRANLATSNTANTPALDDWSIGWRATPDVIADSVWSNEVTSIQDASAPTLAATSSVFAANTTYTLTGTAGDLSGVATVTVNGTAAATSDGFAHWSLPVTLATGTNNFTIVAQDSAVPANVRTINFAVSYSPADTNGNGLPDAWETQYGLTASDFALGDLDRDGVANIVEYALGLDPTISDGQTACWTTKETNPTDGKLYLVTHYRRRTDMIGWGIDVETSTNATLWSAATSGFEETQAPTPLGDGTTEIVHVRVLQPIGPGGAPAAFVRLRVHAL